MSQVKKWGRDFKTWKVISNVCNLSNDNLALYFQSSSSTNYSYSCEHSAFLQYSLTASSQKIKKYGETK